MKIVKSFFGGGGATTQGQNQTPEEETKGAAGTDVTTMGNMTMDQSYAAQNLSARGDQRRKHKGKKEIENIYVTLIVTNNNDIMQINQIFEEARIHAEQNDPNAQVLQFYEDSLLEFMITMDRIHSYTFGTNTKDKDNCPICKKHRIDQKGAQRKCKCGPDVYLVYAFKFDKIGSKNNSQQG